MAEEPENQESENEVDQDAMMAEWEAMADEGDVVFRFLVFRFFRHQSFVIG